MNFTSRLPEMAVPLIGALLLVVALLIPSTPLAYAITLLLAFAALVRPKQTILFLLIYFPMRSFLVEVNPALKLIGDIIIVFAFLRVVWDSRKDVKSIFRFELYEWAFLAFLLVGTISAFMSNVVIGAIVFQLRAFVITFLLLYIVKRLEITKRDIKNFLTLTLVVAIILVIQGLVEKLSMRSALMPEKWVNRQLSPNNSSRIYGLLNNPNVLSVYLTIAGILTYYLKTLLPKNKVQWLINIALVLIAGTWILTYSRGTWIAFAVSLAVYFLFTRNWKFVVKSAAVIGLGFVLITVPVTYGTQWISSHTEIGNFVRTGAPDADAGFAVEGNRIAETFNASTLDKSKTTGRLFIVNKGFEVFKDYPIMGSGFGTYGDSATKTYSSPIYKFYDIRVNIYSDNQYIQVIAQNGAVGVILFAVFLLGMLVTFWKKRKESAMAVPMLAALIGIFWCGLVYNIWEDKTFTMYYYMLMAGFLALTGRKNELLK
ncbi:O-antigen ligase family protein [Sporosarcina beigongshangi]|uniref:O-antigen ligase family protein n=1 Tax=Sporosarcina beigongshangi TaxID=2782538 RepID=UPI001939E9FF|nr:O-antigen ligase family protein [Sporosarcina beigongshangi]